MNTEQLKQLHARLMATPERLTRKATKEYLSVSVRTLEEWARSGKPPKCYRIGRKVFYDKAELDAFLEACKR